MQSDIVRTNSKISIALFRKCTTDLNRCTYTRTNRQEYHNKRLNKAMNERPAVTRESCVRLLKMPRLQVNREEKRNLIVQTSGAISMINESNYSVRSATGHNVYNVTISQSGWICSCPDHVYRDVKCKHVYAVEFYRSQSVTF